MNKRNRTIVSAVLISKDNKILFGRQRPGGVYPDCWHIPGGGLEEGETLEQGLNREVLEEVGVDIAGLDKVLLEDKDTAEAEKTDKITGEKFIAVMQFNTFLVNLPQTADKIAVSMSDDLEKLIWIPKSELKNYQMTPPGEKLFKALG